MTTSLMPSGTESVGAFRRSRSRAILAIVAALFSAVIVFVTISAGTVAATADTTPGNGAARRITTTGADDAMSVVIAAFGLAVFGLVWFMTRRRAHLR